MGSSPSSGTTFPLENSPTASTERLLNAQGSEKFISNKTFLPEGKILSLNKKRKTCDNERMYEPLVVTYRNLSARIVYAPSDQLYHASWSLGGLRGKVASRKLKTAKEKVLKKLKLLYQGRLSTLAGVPANNMRTSLCAVPAWAGG